MPGYFFIVMHKLIFLSLEPIQVNIQRADNYNNWIEGTHMAQHTLMIFSKLSSPHSVKKAIKLSESHPQNWPKVSC